MGKKQTAVKLILDKFNLLSDNDFKSWMLNHHDELIEMEREQIDHAWNDGFLEGIDGGVTAVAKEYMNRIFGGQDER